MNGKIIKGIAGFYYVYGENGRVYECKAKGIFRKDGKKPLVGDNVSYQVLSEEDAEGHIEQLLPRKNELIRPAVANVDQAVIIFAAAQPEPNYNLLDRFLLLMQMQSVPCLICINKTDLVSGEALDQIAQDYRDAGCELLFTSTKTGYNLDRLRACLRGKTTVAAGPSGVGKSSLVNCMTNSEIMETGEISQKIRRGKNTTRHTQLLSLGEQSFLLDTPGFSSLSLFLEEKETLRFYYPEFTPYEGKCRYHGCMHMSEPDCTVKQAVEEGRISELRYENYKQMFTELSNRKKY